MMVIRYCSAQNGGSATGRFAATAVLLLLTAVTGSPSADEPGDAQRLFIELDREMQAIKSEILAVNQEILALQDLSLYPVARQVVVMVTVADRASISPERVTMRLDGEVLGDHLYSPRESQALLSGGAHRLYTGALEDGEHRVEATVSSAGSDGETVSASSGATFDKKPGRAFLELHLSSRQDGREPVLTIRQWP